MRLLPSRARLAGIGLAIASVTIIAIAGMVLLDLTREAALHREVIDAQLDKDTLYSLRGHVQDLRAAARLAARAGEPQAFLAIERRAAQVDAEVVTLEHRAESGAELPFFPALAHAARLLAMHARSIPDNGAAMPAAPASALAEEADRLASEAIAALDRSLEAQARNINHRTLAQIALGERLRNYVTVLLVGSIVVLAGIFAGYRRAQLREREAQRRIEHLAHFDLVTSLPNRALLADRLAQETARARRASRGFAVLMFDLDGFKEVNDTWGHAAGDRVLAIVAERARKCMRASDTVGRLGGDEFLAILPEVNLEGAMHVAEKLRESMALPCDLDGKSATIGASVGVSLYPEHGADPESLQRAADAALYRAKREGKNRTVVATAVAARPSDARSAA